jgi:hypothetical protein
VDDVRSTPNASFLWIKLKAHLSGHPLKLYHHLCITTSIITRDANNLQFKDIRISFATEELKSYIPYYRFHKIESSQRELTLG